MKMTHLSDPILLETLAFICSGLQYPSFFSGLHCLRTDRLQLNSSLNFSNNMNPKTTADKVLMTVILIFFIEV